MTLILTQIVPTLERALRWLLYFFFLFLVFSALALGLLGSAIMLISRNVDRLLWELFLLPDGGSGSEGEVVNSDGVSQSSNAVAIGTSMPGTPTDDFEILCSPAASCTGEDLSSLYSLLDSPPSSTSSASPPSSLPQAPGARGEFATGHYPDAEFSEFEEYPGGEDVDDDASDASSAYGEIQRDLYFDGVATARWNLEEFCPPSDMVEWEISRAGREEELDASDASSEYGLVSRDLYFGGYEAARGMA